MGYWNSKRNGFVPYQDEDCYPKSYTDEEINEMLAQGKIETGTDGSPVAVPRPQPTAEQKQAQYENRVDELIRERYTLSQELAILRQQESKSEEYQEYFEYCEQCKTKARAEVQSNEV